MIVGERKPLAEIAELLEPFRKILVLGCGTCVTVCLAGGEKEAAETASALAVLRKKAGKEAEIDTQTMVRQCEYEFIDEDKDKLDNYDAILSLACGVGVQTMTTRLPEKIIMPGLNTTFMGYPLEQGVWTENCLGCGDCELGLTMGICPITRCSKSMMNGPCGGSQEEKCEVSKDVDCAWHLIYERLLKLGMAGRMAVIQPPKNWATSHHGGPRTSVREDVRLENGK